MGSSQSSHSVGSLPEMSPAPHTTCPSSDKLIRDFEVISTNEVDKLPKITNLNGLFNDLYIRYIALKRDDFTLYYRVFCQVHQELQGRMKEVDCYYKKYSSRKQIAGSNFDKIRIKKPDEFDMDIVIGLPLDFDVNPLKPDESDIIFEHASAGYIQLKMGVQFKRLPMRDGGEWLTNKTAYEWADEKGYLLRSKFIFWFKSVIKRALNKFEKASDNVYYITVDGIKYTIQVKDGLLTSNFIVENREQGFKLDIDFVPAMKFPEKRWPISGSYRPVPPGCGAEDWMVVPKPDRSIQNVKVQDRAWRLAMHNQEKKIMHDYNNMKQALRFMKMLRDAQGMSKLASYYVKTLFLWEIVERNDPGFWSRSSPSAIFKVMVDRLRQAVDSGNIRFFWNKGNNLIGSLPKGVLAEYSARLQRVQAALAEPARFRDLAQFLLTPLEYSEYSLRLCHI